MSKHEAQVHTLKRRIVNDAGKCLGIAKRAEDEDRASLFAAHQLLHTVLVILDRVHDRAKIGDHQ